MQQFSLTSAGFARHLQPCLPVQAFLHTADLLVGLAAQSPQQVLLSRAESRRTKEELLTQIERLAVVPEADGVRTMSLQSLASGLLSGALDGAALYRLGAAPEPCQVPESCRSMLETLSQYLEVADQQWRGLDCDQLQLQAGYARHINRSTHDENVDYLQVRGRQPGDARRAFLETFRTGYSLGLIDSAIVFLTGERPDPLPIG